MAEQEHIYQSKNKIRVVTASSLFDGHDAAINIMRRIMQRSGAEIIHLGHNRSAQEIVNCAIQEDANAIAITSYQGGHLEFFKYTYDLLEENQSKIKIVGGGGGTILSQEIAELEAYGITKIYSPEDGQKLGLQGMINDLLERCDYDVLGEIDTTSLPLPSLISLAENNNQLFSKLHLKTKVIPVIGITGTGGAGKSTFTDEVIRRFELSNLNIAVLSIDPTRKRTGGALLGDRIRMNAIAVPQVFMRSMATRQANTSINHSILDVITCFKSFDFDLIIIETSGTGQSDTAITDIVDLSIYVMTPEYGASSQLEKIDMLDYADLIVLNKNDKQGANDALVDVRKQYRRNYNLWDVEDNLLPIFSTKASQFQDPGTDLVFNELIKKLVIKQKVQTIDRASTVSTNMIPPARFRYLAEISEHHQKRTQELKKQLVLIERLEHLEKVLHEDFSEDLKADLRNKYNSTKEQINKEYLISVNQWDDLINSYQSEIFTYSVRNKEIHIPLTKQSISGNNIPKIAVPKFSSWADRLRWLTTENFPGHFPYTAGVFPFKRTNEDPTRMFAGEGGPARTNKRFHYLSQGQPAKRLSTAFDSVTLYGENPAVRPDIYGKIGNSGVNVATLDDAKVLYSGFDLSSPNTSVSMTINGPAPILLAFFLNTAIDQQCEKQIKQTDLLENPNKMVQEYFNAIPEGNDQLGLKLLGKNGNELLDKELYDQIKQKTLQAVRGTVQADILKEDQAQNTCIFSTDFSLKLMGDIQEYFIQNEIRNFYSVSISGYHIAEAGANPVTQLAFTLANGFTYIEYYLSRGMKIDDFASSLSFFFSNGMDAEYAVIGRVARRIWANALNYVYQGNERSQKLKYHIQTSGRSLHAQEIDFNDMRTTLQALYAIYDNCNSLHTNAYDEAITTPTEESVRRAMAIQLIINKELGLNINENTLQGSFIIEELTDLVEEAVYKEFERISERGGVLGAMERMYQRNKIQEESMYYESLKNKGELEIIGVNTFTSDKSTEIKKEVIRSSDDEKQHCIKMLSSFHKRNENKAPLLLEELKETVRKNENVFEKLMEVSRYCSLGQITKALYEVGGQYRRNM